MSGTKKNLSAMLGDSFPTASSASPRPAQLEGSPAPLAGAARELQAVAAEAAIPSATMVVAPAPSPAAKWITLEPKQTRQRKDQIRWVEIKRKELNTLRQGTGERLTDNTLIRVALDLLIHHGDELQGTTETELRSSLGIPSTSE